MLSGVLLTAASAAEHPLIDLDFTVFVQLFLFIITGLVASKFLFRPYLKMREERTAGIEGAREEASLTSAQADAQLAEYEVVLSKARGGAENERRMLRAEAAAHERHTLEATHAQAVAGREAARMTISKDTEIARQELKPRAHEIAAAVASKLLGREVA